jgi:hypothetical protein
MGIVWITQKSFGTSQLTYTLGWHASPSQEDVMAYSSSRLPSRFPVGTKFVIEGRRRADDQSGDVVQVFSRYLEFPDGTFFPLPTHPVQRKSGASRRSAKPRSRRH